MKLLALIFACTLAVCAQTVVGVPNSSGGSGGSGGTNAVQGAPNLTIAGCVSFQVSNGTLTCVSGLTWDGTNLNVPGPIKLGLGSTGAIDFLCGTTPASPPSGYVTPFCNSANSNHFSIVNSAGTVVDLQFISSLTTTGTSGAATVSGGVLNIPQYAGGGGASPAGSYAENQYRLNSSTFGAVTNSGPVPTASWTLRNCGSASGRCWIDDFSANGVVLGQEYNGTLNFGSATQPLTGSSTPYTVIAQLLMAASNEVAGLALTDGTKFYSIEILNSGDTATSTLETRQSAGFNVGGTVANATLHVAGGQMTLKITDDGTHRTWYYWSNGAFVQLLQETTATYLTPTAVGPISLNNLSTGAGVSALKVLYWCISAATTCNGQ